MGAKARGQKLLDAISKDKFDDVLKLLQKPVDFTVQQSGDNALHLAARKGRLDIIKVMVEKGADIKQKNQNGNTVAHYAAKEGNLDILQYLKSLGVDMNTTNDDGSTPLHGAVINQPMDVIEIMVDFGMNPNVTNRRNGQTPAHVAAMYGRRMAIEALAVKGGRLDIKDDNGNTVAHYAAKEGYLEILQYLKSLRVDMNTNNNDGSAPLHGAVINQPMDVIEMMVDFGMDPNVTNTRNGQTPAHVAAMYGRRMAIEALAVKGGRLDIKDDCQRVPEDVAKDGNFRQILRTYDAIETAFGLGAIPAAGTQLTNSSALQVNKIERVGIIIERIEKLDVPSHSPASFYCRRENPENASVPLKHFEDEHVFSDVFIILISNVSQACPASIYLPLQKAPSPKEELVTRFISSGETDRKVAETVVKDEISYCPLKILLVPDVSCICLLYVRPRQEEFVIPTEGTFIETSMEPDFSLDVPPGAFESDTSITMKVFDTHELNVKRESDCGMKAQSCPLMTSVFDITLSGDQPKKDIKMQLPVTGDLYEVEEIVVLRTEENAEIDEASDVLPVKAKLINNNLIFTISHFSTYVAVPKDKILTKQDAKQIERHLSFARERRKPATFFAVVKHTEDPSSFVMAVDFGVASKSHARHRRWVDEGFETHGPMESEAFMVTPGDCFYVDVKGNASFEDPSDGKERMFCFSACRTSCYQTFKIQLDGADLDRYCADVVVYKEIDSHYVGYEREVCRLRIDFPKPSYMPTPNMGRLLPINTPSPRQVSLSNTPRQPHTPRQSNTPSQSNTPRQSNTTGQSNTPQQPTVNMPLQKKLLKSHQKGKGTLG